MSEDIAVLQHSSGGHLTLEPSYWKSCEGKSMVIFE